MRVWGEWTTCDEFDHLRAAHLDLARAGAHGDAPPAAPREAHAVPVPARRAVTPTPRRDTGAVTAGVHGGGGRDRNPGGADRGRLSRLPQGVCVCVCVWCVCECEGRTKREGEGEGDGRGT